MLLFKYDNSITRTEKIGDSADFVSRPVEKDHRIFTCGYDMKEFYIHMFEDWFSHGPVDVVPLTAESAKDSNSFDLLVYGWGGYCNGWGKQKIDLPWTSINFFGTALFVSQEWFGGDIWINGTPPLNSYFIGYVADSKQNIRVFGVAVDLLLLGETCWSMIFMHERKPKSTKEHYMVYTASNCVPYREEAVVTLSQIDTVHYGGSCFGNIMNASRIVPASNKRARGEHMWKKNWNLYSVYRFCLVLENHKIEGYVTEKILHAFLGGCIPVYYGTEEIFAIFNRNAFIYYNVSDPQPAIDRIAYLEANKTAYDEILFGEPILADGNKTIEKYFSLSDEIGNGKLKRRIREMIKM